MRPALHSALYLLLLPVTLRADSWLPPRSHSFISDDASLVVRVDPGSQDSESSKHRPAHCRIFRYSDEKKVYEFWREHDLVNDTLPGSVVVPDDGTFLVTFDDYMGFGTSENTVVIYDSTGRKLKAWSLTDLLPEGEIEELPSTTSSIRWRGDVGMMYSQREVFIAPPESRFDREGGKQFKGFVIDLNGLTVSEDTSWRKAMEISPSSSIWIDRKVFRFWKWLAIIATGSLVATGIRWALLRVRRQKPDAEQAAPSDGDKLSN